MNCGNKFNNEKIKRKDLLYPDLSYLIIGGLFEVHNSLGVGFLEKYYHKAIASLLKKEKISFKKQVAAQVKIGDIIVAEGRADFVSEEKIILEIKKGDIYRKQNIDQVKSYLNSLGLQLGILANFTSKGLLYKRIVNIK